MRVNHVLYILLLVTFSGCIVERPTYYVSPVNGNNTAYYAMPLKKDSVRTATYAAGSLYFGSANTLQTDKVFLAEGNIYQTRQWGIFEAYYGANWGLGNYKVASFDTSTFYTTADWKALNALSGNKMYAAFGVAGGIDLVHTTRHGEWRILGAEMAVHQDAGSYLKFRKELPGDAANLIIRSSNLSTIGFNTETVRKTKRGSYSLKFAYGFPLNKAYNNAQALDFFSQTTEHIIYNYSTLTFQYTYGMWTGYLQMSGSGYANGTKLGVIYKLK